MESKSSNGVIVAQGGVSVGYVGYLRDGKLKFTVREDRAPVIITASETPSAAFKLEARLAHDEAMMLAIDGRTVAQAQAPSLISRQPMEDFCVGHEDRVPVWDFGVLVLFVGTIKNLQIAAGQP